MLYRVQWRYDSGLTRSTGGAWPAGKLVDLTDAIAAAINADQPGVLSPAPEASMPPSEARMETGAQNRMATAQGATRGPGRPRKAAGA